jgi:hypothetical protein
VRIVEHRFEPSGAISTTSPRSIGDAGLPRGR